jgi:hypothetical protein
LHAEKKALLHRTMPWWDITSGEMKESSTAEFPAGLTKYNTTAFSGPTEFNPAEIDVTTPANSVENGFPPMPSTFTDHSLPVESIGTLNYNAYV